MDWSLVALGISIVVGLMNIVDKIAQKTRSNHQDLIEYQIKEIKTNNKEMADDIKEIKNIVIENKENFRSEIRNALEEHIRQFHMKEK